GGSEINRSSMRFWKWDSSSLRLCPTFVIGHPSYFPHCHPDPFDFAQDKGPAKDLSPAAPAHSDTRRPSVIPARSKRESICSRHTRHLLSGIYLIVILSSSEGSEPSRTRAQERLPTPYTPRHSRQSSAGIHLPLLHARHMLETVPSSRGLVARWVR
ncbi:MAG: hypothetical protein OEZ41_11215, partial [Nitrospirota bacterium]|nr:hypothetical protein [Nitrospirota bacterium]